MERFYLKGSSGRRGGRSVKLYRIEQSGRLERRHKVGELRGWRANLAHTAILESLRRGKPKANHLPDGTSVLITEEDGIRLHLTFRGIANIMGVSRASEYISGVYEMSREEAYYWYAKTQNGSAGRGVCSLRVLLAGVN